jgi:hypothetical protein
MRIGSEPLSALCIGRNREQAIYMLLDQQYLSSQHACMFVCRANHLSVRLVSTDTEKEQTLWKIRL